MYQTIKNAVTVLISLVLILLGFYLGIWVMLVGGIVDIVCQVKAETVNGLALSLGILKVVFFELPIGLGWLLAIFVCGISVITDTKPTKTWKIKF